MPACGLDFGTSNTTLGTMMDGVPVLAPLEDGETTIPSAIFYGSHGGVVVGRKAMQSYIEGASGRLMRSLKSALGTSLADETTIVGRERVKFRKVIASYIGAVKRRAEEALGRGITQVVHGRPVHFVDYDPAADRRAEDALREIAREVGFKDIAFQFEPIAAALDYERQVAGEEIALIADIGGGTSDFSVVRLGPDRQKKADRSSDILANEGIRVGGTDFDRNLSLKTIMPLLGFGTPMKKAGLDVPSSYFHDLSTWSSINRLYDRKVMTEIRNVRRESEQPELLDRLLLTLEEQRGHMLLMNVEAAKIALSDKPRAAIDLAWMEAGLAATIDRTLLVAGTEDLRDRITENIRQCLKQAGAEASRIDVVFLTGGSVRLSHVRKAITSLAPSARIVDGDTFGAVGKGLTIEAARRFG